MKPLLILAGLLFCAGAGWCDVTVLYISGDVDCKVGTAKWKPVTEGDKIPDNAYVRTGSGSTVELLKPNLSRLVMGENCLAALKLDGRNDRVLLQVGTLLASLEKAGASLQVRTQTANFGVRGTRFTVKVNPRAGSQMAVEEGRVYALGTRDRTSSAPGVLVPANNKVALSGSDVPALSETTDADQVTFGFALLEQMADPKADLAFDAFQKQQDAFFDDFVRDDLADFQLYKLEQMDQFWDFQLANNPARAKELYNAPLTGE